MHRFLVITELAGGNYSAVVPDMPGCVATGATRAEVEANIQVAIEMHLEGLAEDFQPIPEPRAEAMYMAV